MNRRQFLQLSGSSMLGFYLGGATQVFADDRIKGKAFTIIALPDTQGYVKYKGLDKVFTGQTKWIAENKKKLNIKFVAHEGDIVDNNSPEQWKIARKCMSELDEKVPYGVCVGNHDIKYKGPLKSPVCDYFKVKDYEKETWWGGKMEDENCFFYKFQSGQQKYLMLSLNFGADDKMLAWADKIVTKHKDHLVIMFTHSYLHDDGTLSGPKDKKNAGHYGKHANGNRRNTGQEIWEKHVSKHENYLMVLSGHKRGPAARLEGKGKKGNKIHQLMANYQYTPRCGNGYLRIIQFEPKQRQIAVKTYSPNLKKYWEDKDNQFELS